MVSPTGRRVSFRLDLAPDVWETLAGRAREQGYRDPIELIRNDLALAAVAWEERQRWTVEARPHPAESWASFLSLLLGGCLFVGGLVTGDVDLFRWSAIAWGVCGAVVIYSTGRRRRRRRWSDSLDQVAALLGTSPVGVWRYADEMRAATGCRPRDLARALDSLVATGKVEHSTERHPGDPNGPGRPRWRLVTASEPALAERLDRALGPTEDAP